MSYKKGLFFFHVLYSVSTSALRFSPRAVRTQQTLIDQALSLIIFFFVAHIDCKCDELSGSILFALDEKLTINVGIS
jgi:hypothetical protein